MNKFYLPQIERIIITDYLLYKCPFTIDFNSKLNIVFGTNGTGKSTLLMIILFSIIGPYKGGIKTKTRLDQRKDNRPFYSEEFFRDRTVDNSSDAKVKAEFVINRDKYEVEHSLYDGKLLKAVVNGSELEGKIVTYRTFESKFTRSREMENNDDSELREYLIYNYQKSIKDSTCLPGGVNTLISMLLDVMFFDEGRNFTFWNADLQETVIGKYIVDKDFYEGYCEKKLDTKAFESAYKKKSETLNFMKTFFENEKKEKEGSNEIDETKLRIRLINIENKIQRLEEETYALQSQYKKHNDQLMFRLREIEKIQEKIRQLDETWYNNLFPSQYNKYYKRFSNKMLENICPICGKRHTFNMQTEKCIFCEEELEISATTDLISVDINRKNQQIALNKKNIEMEEQKRELSDLKKKILDNKKFIEKEIVLKNQIEVELKPNNSYVEDNDEKRLDKARDDRDEALKILNACRTEEEKMRSVIENSLVDNFRGFAETFRKYARSFFGENHDIRLSLPFKEDNSLDNLMIKFKLDNRERNESFMLSESQRIFTDLAFRFSILATFHEKSFFMCETPDSTLDMFHETNAVKTFKEYIKMGNSLIVTANARKSNLISKLYGEFDESERNVIDLTQVSNLALFENINFYDYVGGNY